MSKNIQDNNCLNDLRRSLEITVSFLIAILIVILTPLIVTIPGFTYNSLGQYSNTVHFEITLYNSFFFLLLVVSIVCVWLFIALSYLVGNVKNKVWALSMSVVFLLFTSFALLSILWVHSNFLSGSSLSVIIGSIVIGVLIYVGVFFWRIAKYNICH
jgi:hypothetical protein